MNTEREIKRGDVFYIYPSEKFPAIGSEYVAGRPGVIVSTHSINRTSPVVEVCYLTLKKKKVGYHTHVHIPSGKCNNSTVLCEHITTVSKDRLGDFITHLPQDIMTQIDVALLFSLDLPFSSDSGESILPIEETSRTTEEALDMINENESLRHKVSELQNQNDALKHELSSKTSSGVDSIYKELYYDLLDRVTRK